MWYKWLRDYHLSWDFINTGLYISLFKKHPIHYFSYLKLSVTLTFGNVKRFFASFSGPVELLESVSFLKFERRYRKCCPQCDIHWWEASIHRNVFRKLSVLPLLCGSIIMEFYLALIALLLPTIDNDFLTGREVIQNACLTCNWNLGKWLAS